MNDQIPKLQLIQGGNTEPDYEVLARDLYHALRAFFWPNLNDGEPRHALYCHRDHSGDPEKYTPAVWRCAQAQDALERADALFREKNDSDRLRARIAELEIEVAELRKLKEP